MVVMFVDKIMSACCGDSPLINAMKTKLPWHKNSNNTDDDDVADSGKVNSNKINLATKKKGKFADKEMKYELAKWKDLPLKARRAAEDLGYNPTAWDNAEDLPIEHKHWHDLSEAEIKAAEVLGWDHDAWEHKYEHKSWNDLPELQKKAATSAGFTQEEWDHDHWPEHLHKRWDDLKEEDRQAMAVLGWHRRCWD